MKVQGQKYFYQVFNFYSKSNSQFRNLSQLFSNLRAQRWVTSFYNVICSRGEELARQFKAREISEEDLKEAVRDIVKGYGKDAFFRKKTRFSKQWKTNR